VRGNLQAAHHRFKYTLASNYFSLTLYVAEMELANLLFASAYCSDYSKRFGFGYRSL